jgi:lipopolysaccharide assembly protein A
MRYVYMVLVVVLLLLTALFMLQNATLATVSILGASVTLPMSLIVAGVYLLGMLTGSFVLAFVRNVTRGARVPAIGD